MPKHTAPGGPADLREIRHFIDGAFVAGTGGQVFANLCPTTGETLGTVPEATAEEVDLAVAAARDALHGPWGRMPTSERLALLHAVADEIGRRFDDFLAAEVADTGKPRALARSIDIPRGAANFRVFADLVKSVPTESFFLETPDGQGAVNYAVRKPKGVIAVISPWNLPLLLMTWKVGPALACGNCVVVKPSEETPQTATLLGEVMNAVGIPPGVYNVVHGHGPAAAGEFLTRHPGVDAITFTGETRTGEAIMQAAAAGVRDVSFELGGKNPGIVFADADFDAALEGHPALRLRQLRPGLPRHRAPLCRAADLRRLRRRAGRAGGGAQAGAFRRRGDRAGAADLAGPPRQGEELLRTWRRPRGATVVTGGGIPPMGALDGGWWIEPTIWTGLADDSRVVTEEIFGPCCHIRPFDSEEEVLALANATPYGLAAALWTGDSARSHRLARRLEAGVVWVNSWFLRDLRTPFGGTKASGIGREGGLHSLEFYSELSNVCMKL